MIDSLENRRFYKSVNINRASLEYLYHIFKFYIDEMINDFTDEYKLDNDVDLFKERYIIIASEFFDVLEKYKPGLLVKLQSIEWWSILN